MTAITLELPQLEKLLTRAAEEGAKRVLSPYLSVDDMCQRYKCSRATIYARVERGELPRQSAPGLWKRSELESQ